MYTIYLFMLYTCVYNHVFIYLLCTQHHINVSKRTKKWEGTTKTVVSSQLLLSPLTWPVQGIPHVQARPNALRIYVA